MFRFRDTGIKNDQAIEQGKHKLLCDELTDISSVAIYLFLFLLSFPLESSLISQGDVTVAPLSTVVSPTPSSSWVPLSTGQLSLLWVSRNFGLHSEQAEEAVAPWKLCEVLVLSFWSGGVCKDLVTLCGQGL